MEQNAKPKSTVSRIFAVVLAVLYAIAGYYFIAHPIVSLNVAAVIFIIFFMAAGFMEVISYFVNRKNGGSVWMLVLGIINIILCIYILSSTYHLVTFLPFMMAFWAIFSGVTYIGFAFTKKKMEQQWVSTLIIGIVMIIIGILMFSKPLISILTVSFLFAISMWAMVINYLVAAFTK